MAQNDAELREIPASEILDKIQKGEPVLYYHVRVTGDLDVNKLDLPTKHVDRNEDLIEIGSISEEYKVVSTSIEITKSTFNGKVNFSNIFFEYLANFENTTFISDANFIGAKFGGIVNFSGATFGGITNFAEATFINYANFAWATFSGMAVGFAGTTFSDYANFSRATFSMNVYFNEATFSGVVGFSGAKFAGDVLTFRNAIFNEPKSQEEACRRAKNVLAKAGNRDEEECHFYREMEAKRMQNGIRGNKGLDLSHLKNEAWSEYNIEFSESKGLQNRISGNSGLGVSHWLKTQPWYFLKSFFYDVLELLFVQKIFGYGVHPWRVIISWFSIVALFTFVYWVIDGMKGGLLGTLNYLEGSFATAIAPGYIAVIINSAAYTPIYHKIAILETIIGTFLWAGFIATFAKRYMR